MTVVCIRVVEEVFAQGGHARDCVVDQRGRAGLEIEAQNGVAVLVLKFARRNDWCNVQGLLRHELIRVLPRFDVKKHRGCEGGLISQFAADADSQIARSGGEVWKLVHTRS